MCTPIRALNPEERLASEFRTELGVEINPQALRMFIRSRWRIVSGLAHAIHDAGTLPAAEGAKLEPRQSS
jgi:hypothetical protein